MTLHLPRVAELVAQLLLSCSDERAPAHSSLLSRALSSAMSTSNEGGTLPDRLARRISSSSHASANSMVGVSDVVPLLPKPEPLRAFVSAMTVAGRGAGCLASCMPPPPRAFQLAGNRPSRRTRCVLRLGASPIERDALRSSVASTRDVDSFLLALAVRGLAGHHHEMPYEFSRSHRYHAPPLPIHFASILSTPRRSEARRCPLGGSWNVYLPSGPLIRSPSNSVSPCFPNVTATTPH